MQTQSALQEAGQVVSVTWLHEVVSMGMVGLLLAAGRWVVTLHIQNSSCCRFVTFNYQFCCVVADLFFVNSVVKH